MKYCTNDRFFGTQYEHVHTDVIIDRFEHDVRKLTVSVSKISRKPSREFATKFW